jgi:hypothetical protein
MIAWIPAHAPCSEAHRTNSFHCCLHSEACQTEILSTIFLRILVLAPVVETRGAGIGMPGQALNVLARDILHQDVGDRRDTEEMGRVEQGQAETLNLRIIMRQMSLTLMARPARLPRFLSALGNTARRPKPLA